MDTIKTQALARLTALESEATELRKILEAPDPAASLLTKPRPFSNQEYFSLARDSETNSTLKALNCFAKNNSAYPGGNMFQTKELAEAYAKALNTLLLLRHQPGTVAPAKCRQYHIATRNEMSECVSWADEAKISKVFRLSSCFATRDQADAAIKAVGQDNIIHMFKTLHHLG